MNSKISFPFSSLLALLLISNVHLSCSARSEAIKRTNPPPGHYTRPPPYKKTSTRRISLFPSSDGDQQALLSFKATIGSDPYGAMSSWNTSMALCRWAGVTCTQQQQKPSRVSGLVLEHLSLAGTLSPSLANLTRLATLSLSGNILTGEIPPALGALPSLTFLNLSSNGLQGPVPTQLHSLSNLTHLNLSRNSLTGVIPPSLGTLYLLTSLDLSHNNLSGDFPEYLADFPYLEHIDVSFNDLTGKVPTDGVFANRTAVSVVGNSQLCGGILSLDLPAC